MRRLVSLMALVCLPLLGTGCFGEAQLFPIFDPELFDSPPLPLGEFAFEETRVEFDDLGDGDPGGVTVFSPVDAESPRPALIWVLGINNRAHYHQSFHEHMASQGFVNIVPDTRDFSFFDFQFHRRNVDNAVATFARAVNGELGVTVDPDKIAFGGYSIGATMAVFSAAEEPRAAALAIWAPTGAPYWTGLKPRDLYPEVRVPVLFMLGEFDPVAPPSGFPADLQASLINAPSIDEFIVPEGTHLYFQQPSGVDDRVPFTTITRPEQQAIAIAETRDFLTGQFSAR